MSHFDAFGFLNGALVRAVLIQRPDYDYSYDTVFVFQPSIVRLGRFQPFSTTENDHYMCERVRVCGGARARSTP